MVRLSEILKIEGSDALGLRYGKAFEKAVLVLLKTRDIGAAPVNTAEVEAARGTGFASPASVRGGSPAARQEPIGFGAAAVAAAGTAAGVVGRELTEASPLAPMLTRERSEISFEPATA